MTDKMCPLKDLLKDNREQWWCNKSDCAWWYESAKMCSVVMIANGLNHKDKE